SCSAHHKFRSADIYMAQSAGLHNAWARYGTEVDHALWSRLVRVTHWSAGDVQREERIRAEAANTEPEVELAEFSDILERFTFVGSSKNIVGAPVT
ncbi:MAG: hypothetical protein ACLPYS_03360, partial [Vulcanimicrobiaceae bacterium]